MAVARSFSGGVTKSRGVGAVLEIFFPIDNEFYNIAFATHTKAAEPINMPFGMMSGIRLDRDSSWERAIFKFWELSGPLKSTDSLCGGICSKRHHPVLCDGMTAVPVIVVCSH